MPYFYILQVVRSDSPENRNECQIKFYPILENRGASPLAIEAEDEILAWKQVKKRFPNHCRNLAIHEANSYDHLISGLITKRLLRGNANLGADAKAKSPIRHGNAGGDSGVSSGRENRPAENPAKAEHAY
jgi:hypothetical protein